MTESNEIELPPFDEAYYENERDLRIGGNGGDTSKARLRLQLDCRERQFHTAIRVGRLEGLREALRAVMGERLPSHLKHIVEMRTLTRHVEYDLTDISYSHAVNDCEKAITKLIEDRGCPDLSQPVEDAETPAEQARQQLQQAGA